MQEALDASLERASRPEGFTREGQGCNNHLCRAMHGFEIRPGEVVETPPVLTILLEGWQMRPNGTWEMLHTDLTNVLEVTLQGREYRLRSVTLHGQGSSPMCGHYIALACHGVPETWYLYNDDHRVEVDARNLRSHFREPRSRRNFRSNVFVYEAKTRGTAEETSVPPAPPAPPLPPGTGSTSGSSSSSGPGSAT